MNRIKSILSRVEKDKQDEAIWNLYSELSQNREEKLAEAELYTLKEWLKSEKNLRILNCLWRIALFFEGDVELTEYAERVIAIPDYGWRDLALVYLLCNKTANTQEYVNRYRKDPNARVQHQIALIIEKTEPSKAIDMLIDIYAKADSHDHELTDAISLEICEGGTAAHLEKMKRIVKEKPELKSAYNAIIKTLEKKLARILAKEGELLNVLEDLGEIVWRRYQQRYPDAWIDNRFQKTDRSNHPPYISFRFKHEEAEVIQKLIYAVNTYRGKVEWIMTAHKRINLPGVNWCILTKVMNDLTPVALDQEMSPAEYVSRHMPDFGPLAYEDLERLTEHIRKSLLNE